MRGLALSAPRRNFAGIVLDSLPWLAQSLARPLACAFVVWGCWAAGAAAARADNAFPNSQSVLLPRDRPDEIVVATTFGLVFSVDDGATWRYACEDLQTTTGGRKYFVGPPPANRIFALSDLGIPVSNDGACTWTIAGGDVTAMSPFDVFPDPADPLRAYALAKAPNDPDETTGSAYRSFDGGRTFAGPIFTAPPSSVLTGIESAASDPMTVYLTFYELAANGVHPRLATSRDGGDTWTTADLEARLGSLIPRLAAVDPTDPARILLRISSGGGDPAAVDGLVLTTDGGTTFA
ncbi:MAG: hypothetical protein ABUL77_02340, partial [Bacteroidota bacterium]